MLLNCALFICDEVIANLFYDHIRKELLYEDNTVGPNLVVYEIRYHFCYRHSFFAIDVGLQLRFNGNIQINA